MESSHKVEPKRFIVFLGDQYYPIGGARDITGSYDTLDECIERIRDIILHDNRETLQHEGIAMVVAMYDEWCNILDTKLGWVYYPTKKDIFKGHGYEEWEKEHKGNA